MEKDITHTWKKTDPHTKIERYQRYSSTRDRKHTTEIIKILVPVCITHGKIKILVKYAEKERSSCLYHTRKKKDPPVGVYHTRKREDTHMGTHGEQ